MAISVFMILVLFIFVFFLLRIDKFLKKKLTKNFFYEPGINEEKINPDIILFLLFTKKFLIFSFLVLLFIIDKSSSIAKSYSLKRIAEYLHSYSTLIHFLYQFCIKI